jgi:DNA-binding LacI/PurR family transcriptional regulator
LVLLGPQAPTGYIAGLAAQMPVVVVARAVRHRAVDVVRTDDAAGLEQAVDHLVELGHRRIAHIDGGRAPGPPNAAVVTPARCTGTGWGATR